MGWCKQRTPEYSIVHCCDTHTHGRTDLLCRRMAAAYNFIHHISDRWRPPNRRGLRSYTTNMAAWTHHLYKY